MRKYVILVMAILAVVVFSSGCTTDGNQTSDQSKVPTKSYSANGISFDYPESWVELKDIVTANAIVAYGDPKSANASSGNYNTLMIIQKYSMPSNATLKQVYDATYSQAAAQNPTFQQISDTTTTVEGTTAYVNVHKIDTSGVQKQEKAVWLEKDGNVYIILMGALPDAFNSQQENFDTIVNSFKVQ